MPKIIKADPRGPAGFITRIEIVFYEVRFNKGVVNNARASCSHLVKEDEVLQRQIQGSFAKTDWPFRVRPEGYRREISSDSHSRTPRRGHLRGLTHSWQRETKEEPY